MTMTATASDPDGSVASVEFYAGTQRVGSATASPYSATWNNVGVGTYSLTAVATDNAGKTTTSTAVSVTVNTNRAPTVSLSSPASGATYTAPATIAIAATASDTDGSVARVDFYANDQPVGSDTTSPFSFSWTNVAAGTYSLKAIATDNGGATTTSGLVSVTVGSAPVPIQSATLYFYPPVNYTTWVDSCTLEIHRASDGVNVSTNYLGKPAVVNAEISVDITAIVKALPAGSYYTVVVAVGPGGSTPGSPSAVFTRP